MVFPPLRYGNALFDEGNIWSSAYQRNIFIKLTQTFKHDTIQPVKILHFTGI